MRRSYTRKLKKTPRRQGGDSFAQCDTDTAVPVRRQVLPAYLLRVEGRAPRHGDCPPWAQSLLPHPYPNHGGEHMKLSILAAAVSLALGLAACGDNNNAGRTARDTSTPPSGAASSSGSTTSPSTAPSGAASSSSSSAPSSTSPSGAASGSAATSTEEKKSAGGGASTSPSSSSSSAGAGSSTSPSTSSQPSSSSSSATTTE